MTNAELADEIEREIANGLLTYNTKRLLIAALAALRQSSSDQVLVPREPTAEMVVAGIHEYHRQVSEWEQTRRESEPFKIASSFIYSAMLQATEAEGHHE